MTERPLAGERIDLKGGATAWWPCHIGHHSTLGRGCSIGALAHVGQHVTMGEACRVQGGAYIADATVMGDRVFVGPSAVILNDKFPPSGDRAKWQPVTVGDDAVIGGGSTVIPGNNVGARSVLAAGAVLTHPLPEGEVWSGNPARFMMTRDDYDARRGADLDG